MSKSALLRLRDVRAAYRLIGDCRDLGGDFDQWHRRAFEGLCRLVGASVATGGEGKWLRPGKSLQPMTAFEFGFDEVGRDRYRAYMQENGQLADPIFQRIQHIPDRIVTRTRRELVPDRDWYRSISFNEYRRGLGFDHQLSSIYQVSEHGAMSALCLARALGDRDFFPREQRLMRFFHVELGRLVGGPLVSALEPGIETLSPASGRRLPACWKGTVKRILPRALG